MADVIQKLNQEWLGSLSKIASQLLVWLCDQSCLRGAVYCLISKDCRFFTYTLLPVVILEEMYVLSTFLTEMHERRSMVNDYLQIYLCLILIHSNVF